MRRPKDYIFLYIKGLCLGVSGAIHGVSSGTMALIFGIYNELVHSIREISSNFFPLLRQKQLGTYWKKINGTFLLILFAGFLSGIITLTWIIHPLYNSYFILVTSFLFGVVSVSILLLLRKIRKWHPGIVFCLIAGLLIGFSISVTPPRPSDTSLFMVFLSGALSASSLVLPGPSGIFILLLTGKYQHIVSGFAELKIDIIVLYIAGCVTGLIAMARFVAALLAHYQNASVALLAGMMAGLLNKLWPWRKVLEYATNSNGEQIPAFDKSLLPWNFLAETGKDPQVFLAILMMASGVFIVVLIEKIAARLKQKAEHGKSIWAYRTNR